MLKEGQFRNPSGCAVAGVIDRSGVHNFETDI